ncbi:hypothetical protein [Acetobacter sp.]|uniref:hypothetical protein n=1 Tax=Acetobacter sp. TaxID=440 RepID=UPI0039E74A0B
MHKFFCISSPFQFDIIQLLPGQFEPAKKLGHKKTGIFDAVFTGSLGPVDIHPVQETPFQNIVYSALQVECGMRQRFPVNGNLFFPLLEGFLFFMLAGKKATDPAAQPSTQGP